MTLQKLNISNFQSIHNASLEFGKFTVLVGRSNSGKSALLRALHTLVYNSFIPAYVRSGKKTTEIEAEFDDGTVLTRRGGESTYTISSDAVKESFTKCGRDVPKEVSTFLSMEPLAGENLNFTNQFELPFLVSGKGSTASAVVGTITNAVTTQTLAQETNRIRLGKLQTINVREQDLEALQASLTAYEGIPELEGVVRDLRALESNLAALAGGRDDLLKLVVRIEAIDASVVQVPKLPDVDAKDVIKMSEMGREKSALENVVGQLDRLTTPTIPALPEIDSNYFGTLAELTEDKERLSKLLRKIEHARDEYKSLKDVMDAHLENLEEVKEEFASLPLCEACGQPLVDTP